MQLSRPGSAAWPALLVGEASLRWISYMCLSPHPEAWGCLCKVCPGEGVLKKTSSDVPVALQRGKNDLRQFSRSRSPGKALEGLMLQLWVGTRNLYFKKLSLCYSGTGRDTRRRGSAQNWGVAGRPLDSYSSAKKSVTEALKVTVRFQARLSRPRLTAHI